MSKNVSEVSIYDSIKLKQPKFLLTLGKKNNMLIEYYRAVELSVLERNIPLWVNPRNDIGWK